jgi:hypothetical protein
LSCPIPECFVDLWKHNFGSDGPNPFDWQNKGSRSNRFVSWYDQDTSALSARDNSAGKLIPASPLTGCWWLALKEVAMSKRLTDRERLLSKLKHLSDSEIEEVLEFIFLVETKGRERAQREVADDDLLMILSSARENRRARQVFEWESARRRAEARASSGNVARR